MMQLSAVEPGIPSIHSRNLPNENRHKETELFDLIEVDRARVVDSFDDDGAFEQDAVYAVGAMREQCPACQADHLKLVLRQKRVRHAHLYCVSCNKCFDACYRDGSSALEFDD